MAKTPESVKTRRGEPVILTYADGTMLLGTIEFGDETTSCISVYTESDGHSGGRVILQPGERDSPKMAYDPGGARPVWHSLERKKPESTPPSSYTSQSIWQGITGSLRR
jgi:hypothetical protein